MISLYLTLLSMLGTCGKGKINIAAPDEEEQYVSYVFYLPDDMIMHLVRLVLFIVIAAVIAIVMTENFKNGTRNFSNTRCLILIIFCAYIIVEIITVFSTIIYPTSDPLKSQNIAKEILNGDFQAFEKGEYMYRYPFQSGYLLLIYYANMICGDNGYLLLQVINIGADILACYSTYKIAKMIWGGRKVLGILAAELLFLPIHLNIFYVYGDMLGYAAAIVSVYLELKFFKEKRLVWGILSAISITCGVIWKSNALIFLCGIILFALYQFIYNSRVQGASLIDDV